MTVIPIKPARDRRPETRAGENCRSAPIHGTFRSPTGRTGTMRGVLRLERFISGPGGGRVEGVFAGELFDGDGTHLGRDSRRQSALADIWGPGDLKDHTGLSGPTTAGGADVSTGARTLEAEGAPEDARATIRPAHVDLMGLVVTVQPVTMPASCAMGVCDHTGGANFGASADTKREEG